MDELSELGWLGWLSRLSRLSRLGYLGWLSFPGRLPRLLGIATPATIEGEAGWSRGKLEAIHLYQLTTVSHRSQDLRILVWFE